MNKQIRNVFMILAVSALGVSCDKGNDIVDGEIGEPVGEMITITASTEQSPDSRTSLGGEGTDGIKRVLWTENDSIKVIDFSVTDNSGIANAEKFTLSGGEGTPSGTFTGTSVSQGETFAFYPATSSFNGAVDAGENGGRTVEFELPATQTYKAGGFDEAAFPMVAHSASGKDFSFTNLYGILKLSLTGLDAVTKIRVESSSETLSGGAMLLLNDNTLVLDGNKRYVELDCNNGGAGVQLSRTATDFYIVLPPTIASLTITITSSTGGAMIRTTSSPIERSQETRMPAFIFSNPGEYIDRYTYIKGLGIKLSASTGELLWAPFNLGSEGTAENWNGHYFKWGASSPDATEHNSVDATWQAADNPCPAGWRVPTKLEFEALVNGEYTKGNGPYGNGYGTLKNLGFWFGSNSATESSNTDCLWLPLAGISYAPTSTGGYYWSTNENDTDTNNAYNLKLGTRELYITAESKAYVLSVRCVQ